jgi:hypothetical protein
VAAENTKPLDRWLGIGGIVVGVILYLLPEKAPTIVVVCTALIFVLLLHPAWNFWWIEDATWRRFTAVVLLAVSVVCLAMFVWPIPSGSASLLYVVALAVIQRFTFTGPWSDRALGAFAILVALAATKLLRKGWARIIVLKAMHPAAPKGFLDYKAQVETATAALPKIIEKFSKIMARVAPNLEKQTSKLQLAKTTEQQIRVAEDTARRLDGFSRQFNRVCVTYRSSGNSLTEGLDGWSAWVSKSNTNKTGLGPFADGLRIFVNTLHTTNAQTQAYIDSMNSGRGASRALDAGIARHVQSLEMVLEINRAIHTSCLAALGLLESLPKSS